MDYGWQLNIDTRSGGGASGCDSKQWMHQKDGGNCTQVHRLQFLKPPPLVDMARYGPLLVSQKNQLPSNLGHLVIFA